MSKKSELRVEPCQNAIAIKGLIAKNGVSFDDIMDRSIICTASRAQYGTCSHWIISVEGSPPRGTIIFDTVRYTPGVAFLVIQDRSKRLTGKSYDIVSAFVAEFLAKHE
ncbi:hypothetical protein UFOVP1229_8 [uncultured Caudovirales phage]|uniref:Uncharacterized protein n=1 Tax=uncultured Caudovirales phage TaxID=2100421 RepID=A0A6J5RHF9_9CAUD|nr:hypothetical protein UFOVP1229_8 [uncultured Caudovirales phage]